MNAPLLAPFQGWLVRPEWADRVIAGAYDSKTAEQRRAIVEQNPFSYLGVTRSHDDLHARASDAELLDLCIKSFKRILTSGAFAQTTHRAFYAYRLSSVPSASLPDSSTDNHAEADATGHLSWPVEQTGIVGALAVDGLRDGRVLTHENVRPERATLITDHLSQVGATSSPISLAHVAAPELVEILSSVTQQRANVDVVVEGIRNQVWALSAEDTANVQRFVAEPLVYVTDGHHRCAASLAGRDSYPNQVPFARTLGVLFPHDQLRIEAFHRRVPNRASLTKSALLEALGQIGTVTKHADGNDNAVCRPTTRGEVGVYQQGSWFRFTLDPLDNAHMSGAAGLSGAAGSVAALDVERVRREVIGDVLGVNELDHNSGIDYVPDPVGITEFVRRCDADGHIGLLLYPTDIGDLMAVAAAGGLMPPKSSYLHPKPPSGVFLRTLGVGATKHLGPS